MNDSEKGGCLTLIMFLGIVGIIIGSGVLSWNIVEPESFLGAIGFMFLWVVFMAIGKFIGGIILIALSEL